MKGDPGRKDPEARIRYRAGYEQIEWSGSMKKGPTDIWTILDVEANKLDVLWPFHSRRECAESIEDDQACGLLDPKRKYRPEKTHVTRGWTGK